jgi:hypothetical protein
MSDQPTKFYLEVFADGKWSMVGDTFPDDVKALRALVAHRERSPLARVRITDDRARVHLDVPPVASS